MTEYIKAKQDELYHHGILGMKWGVRRYQNKDGSLTPAGRRHYDVASGDKIYKELKKQVRKKTGAFMTRPLGDHTTKANQELEKAERKYRNSKEYKNWEKEFDTYDKKYGDDGIPAKKLKELYKKQPKVGKDYVQAKHNVSIAELKDLGFNDEGAEYVHKKLSESSYWYKRYGSLTVSY